jgi:hypothetical protein
MDKANKRVLVGCLVLGVGALMAAWWGFNVLAVLSDIRTINT